MHQVGYGTGRDKAFAEAIVFEEMPEEFIFSFDSDGSSSPEAIFNKACMELVDRFDKISSDLDRVLA
jgi:hypothetical protein